MTDQAQCSLAAGHVRFDTAGMIATFSMAENAPTCPYANEPLGQIVSLQGALFMPKATATCVVQNADGEAMAPWVKVWPQKAP